MQDEGCISEHESAPPDCAQLEQLRLFQSPAGHEAKHRTCGRGVVCGTETGGSQSPLSLFQGAHVCVNSVSMLSRPVSQLPSPTVASCPAKHLPVQSRVVDIPRPQAQFVNGQAGSPVFRSPAVAVDTTTSCPWVSGPL